MKQRPSPSHTSFTTPRQRFRFLVRFAGLDLTTLREGDLFNVREDLRDLLLPLHSSLAPGGLHTWPDVGPMPEHYSLPELQALQADLQEALALAVVSRRDVTRLRYTPLPSLRYAAPPVPDFSPTAAPGRHFWSVKGSVRDLTLLLFYHLLASQETATLDQCPICERIYLRQTNQKYCSKACTNAVAQRSWRERQATTGAKEV